MATGTHFSTNLAWRIQLITPSQELNQTLIEAAKRPDLAPQFVPLLESLKKGLKDDDPLLDSPIFYTTWGLRQLEAAVTALPARRW